MVKFQKSFEKTFIQYFVCQPFTSIPDSQREGSGRMAFLARQPWEQSPLPGSFHAVEGSSRNLVYHDPCAWDSAGQPARGAVRELTRNREGLETHLASETVLENCLVSVKVLSKSSHSQSMFSLCQVSIFRVRKPKPKNPPRKTTKKVGKFSTSNRPNGRMLLVFTSLQKEVSKPTLHFTQGHSETEEGEGEQRHWAPLRPASPQSDPKKKML